MITSEASPWLGLGLTAGRWEWRYWSGARGRWWWEVLWTPQAELHRHQQIGASTGSRSQGWWAEGLRSQAHPVPSVDTAEHHASCKGTRYTGSEPRPLRKQQRVFQSERKYVDKWHRRQVPNHTFPTFRISALDASTNIPAAKVGSLSTQWRKYTPQRVEEESENLTSTNPNNHTVL